MATLRRSGEGIPENPPKSLAKTKHFLKAIEDERQECFIDHNRERELDIKKALHLEYIGLGKYLTMYRDQRYKLEMRLSEKERKAALDEWLEEGDA